jgi:hypothetical protein
MGDHAKFSDDISALWGPDDTGGLEPAPLRKVEHDPPSPPPSAGTANGSGNGNGNGSSTVGGSGSNRLAALEREIRLLVDRVAPALAEPVEQGDLDALRTDLEVELNRELTRLRGEVLAQIDVRLADSEARAHDHVREATSQVVERLGVLSTDLRQGIATVAAATEAHEYEPVGKHRARTLRHELQAEFAAQLEAVRAAAEEAVERRIAAAEAQLVRRLDDLPAQVAAAAEERVTATERETARLADLIEVVRTEGVRKPELDATRAEDTRDDRIAQLEQRVSQLGGLHAEELDGVRAELAAMRSELAAPANGNAAIGEPELETEEPPRPWAPHPSLPGS